jgi:HEAT repeat protein
VIQLRNLRMPVLATALCVIAVVCQPATYASSEIPPNANAAESPSLRYHFISGERLIYRLNYASASESDFRALFEDKNETAAESQAGPLGLVQSFNTTVRGEFTISVVHVNAENITVAYSLRNCAINLVANGENDQTDADAIRKDLSRDVFAVVDLDGKVISVRFNPATKKLSQSFARAIIAATQFVFSSDQPSMGQWEVREDDPNGEYVAKYERLGHGPSNANAPSSLVTFEKTITRYLQAITRATPTDFKVTTTISPGGSLTGTFDPKAGRLIALNGAQTQTIDVAGKTIAHSQSTVKFDFVGAERLDRARLITMREASAQSERLVHATPLSASMSEKDGEASIERTELATDSLQSLLTDLSSLESSTGEKNETPIYLKFKALIYLHPESSATLGQILATADAKSLTMRVLTGALSAAGNPPAQSALVGAIKARSTDWPALSMLIPALADASSPTRVAEDAIRDLAFQSPNADITSTAQLALGAIARSLSETSPERATRIVNSLIKQIESSSSADTTRQLLLALGNAGSSNAYSTIAKFATDPSPALRAAAASALRWIVSDGADEQLIKALTSDAEASVRLEAAAALGFRQMTDATFAAEKLAFSTDKDEKVRLALLSNLWKAHQAFPEVRKLIKDAATNDASQDVRKAAADIVAMDADNRIK